MPTAHRLATLRDDLIFFIYLYQYWIYPVDKSRPNEFGYVYEHDQENSDTQTTKEISDTQTTKENVDTQVKKENGDIFVKKEKID